MENFINWVFPLLIMAGGAFAGYHSGVVQKDYRSTAFMWFLACHVMLIFFPVQLLEVGNIFSTEVLEGVQTISVNVPDYSAAFLNFGLSIIGMWGLIFVVGALVDIKKNLLH